MTGAKMQYVFTSIILPRSVEIILPSICYSNIVCIISLFTGTTRSVIMTLPSQVLRHAWVISLRLFGPTAGSLELVTPLERTPNFPDMYACT